MVDYQMFKTVLVKGFDKDEVLAYVQKMEDEGFTREAEHARELKDRDAKIEELKKRINLKDEQKERLENEIEQKYKKYIDHYDSIGRLVYEAEVKAENIIADAQAKADDITMESERSASVRTEEVQKEINEKLSEGKKKYIAVQEEMNEIVELINQAQRRFMTSYKEVHNIIKTMPSSLSELQDVDDEPEDFVDEDDDVLE